MERVAVIGGSNGGYAAAADYADAGYEIRWYLRTPSNHEPVLETESLTKRVSEHYPQDRRKPGREIDVEIGTVTTDLGIAVTEAEVVVIPLPTTAQSELFDELADHLRDGQIVILCPGNFGSYHLQRALKGDRNEVEFTSDLVTAETPTLPFVARRSGPSEVTINLDAVTLPIGGFPGSESEEAARVFGELHEGVFPVTDALDAALTNSNPCVNAVPTVMNAGAIECEEFDRFNIHRHGIGPGTYEVLMRVDDERISLREGLEYEPPHIRQDEYYKPEQADTGVHFYGPDARSSLMAAETFSEDPPALDHRYVHEDIGIACVLWATLGDYLDIPTPTLDAIVELGEVMMDEPFRDEGRSFAKLGLSDLSSDALKQFLREGST